MLDFQSQLVPFQSGLHTASNWLNPNQVKLVDESNGQFSTVEEGRSKLLHDIELRANRVRESLPLIEDGVVSSGEVDSNLLSDMQLNQHQLQGAVKSLRALRPNIPSAVVSAQLDSLSTIVHSSTPFARSLMAKAEGGTLLRDKGSDFYLWDQLAFGINSVNVAYLQAYQEIVSRYVNFYTNFSDKVLAKMGDWVTATSGDNGDKITLDTGALGGALDSLIKSNELLLYKVKDREDSDKKVTKSASEAAKEWFYELTGYKDTSLPRGGISLKSPELYIDVTPLENMKKSLGGLPKDMNSAKFQAWKAGFDSQAEELKSTMQALTQKYSNANSIFDNLVKVLSSTITACLETEKLFLQV